MNDARSATTDDATIDPVVAEVLGQLWAARRESPGKPWALAKLAKRTRLPMSALRRTLTMLEAAGFVEVSLADDGRGVAALTAQGLALFT
jgi:DNA-binding IclR family transcriptional regulator